MRLIHADAPRRLKQIAIYMMYDDGNRVVIRSPERRVKIGLKTKLGYYVMLVGGWLKFGHSKDWETVINPIYPRCPWCGAKMEVEAGDQ